MSYYITPHDKSRYRYIPIDFFECVDIITSINLALGCCFALPSNCMEEKQINNAAVRLSLIWERTMHPL